MTKITQTDWEAELRDKWLRSSGISTIDFLVKEISLARKEEREKVIMEAQFEFAGLGKMTDAEIVDRLDSLKKSL